MSEVVLCSFALRCGETICVVLRQVVLVELSRVE